MKSVRGIRGAITVSENTKEAILEASTTLLRELVEKNELDVHEICSIFFTLTQDLNQEFPAFSARKIGLTDTPLLCMTEISVPGSLEKCLRILIHVNTNKSQKAMKHLYLGGAQKLRPDLE
jgi:chorismate mutase